MANDEDRPLSRLIAQGWEIAGYSSAHDAHSGKIRHGVLLRRQRNHKILSIRHKIWGRGYVVNELDL
jgi:hypothetical protein